MNEYLRNNPIQYQGHRDVIYGHDRDDSTIDVDGKSVAVYIFSSNETASLEENCQATHRYWIPMSAWDHALESPGRCPNVDGDAGIIEKFIRRS